MFAKSPPFEMGFRLDRLNVIPLPVAALNMPEGVQEGPLALGIAQACIYIYRVAETVTRRHSLAYGHVYEVYEDVRRHGSFLSCALSSRPQ